MDRETSPKPPMCRGGCGFYGSAATDGLCSLCYKKHLKRRQESTMPRTRNINSQLSYVRNSSNPIIEEPKAFNSTTDIKLCSSQLSSDPSANEPFGLQPDSTLPSSSNGTNTDGGTSLDRGPDSEGKEKKNRCAECGKKVGLTGFTCRCGGLYCPIHRYSDKHNCTFDYRELGAEEIRRNNPTVTAEKIRKI